MTIVHPVAQEGFGSGTNDLYDRARPSYQPPLIDFVRESLKKSGKVNILELGAGTGIFTRAILADPKWNEIIGELKAVEPSEGMRDVFNRTIQDERVTVIDGTFESTGSAAGWADVVIVAQAFHWCSDHNAACQEFSRVLQPDGIVAFVWNLEDRDAAEWVAKIRDRIEVYEDGAPQFRLMLWRKVFETEAYQSLFKSHEEKIWTYTLDATKDSVVDRASSKSYVARLPDGEKKEVQDSIRNIIDSATKDWVDESKGVFKYPYKGYAVVFGRK